MPRKVLVLGLAMLVATVAHAQPFSSGSTGADGGLVVTQTTTLQVPSSGVFNFTTVTVNQYGVLYFRPNQRNTPVIILAQGDVTIIGGIILDASQQTPGPGGFYGGAAGQAGFGPGGGAPGQPGQWVGPLSLVPAIGGSGGGGSGSYGGGGGGAIVIASSTSIKCHNVIRANGYASSSVPSGAGGAIRLVANSVTGACPLEARAGSGGSHGVIRIEAQPGQLLYTGTSSPSAVLSTVNPEIIPTSTTANLTISSIAGYPVLTDAGTRPGTVDVVVPRAVTDPIAIVVQGSNIPVGTQVLLNVTGSPAATYVAGTLTGSFDLSTATLQVAGLDRAAETHLFVFATFDVPLGAALFNPAGPDQVAKVRVEAAPGSPSTMSFLRTDGSEIDRDKIPRLLLRFLDYPNR